LLRVGASIRRATSLIYQIAHGLGLPAGGTFVSWSGGLRGVP
jgi:hypothetical protein